MFGGVWLILKGVLLSDALDAAVKVVQAVAALRALRKKS